MKRYYKQDGEKTLISNDYIAGWRKIEFETKHEYLNGGCPDNIIWEDGIPRLKNESELVSDAKDNKIASLWIAGAEYVVNAGYDDSCKQRMLAYLTDGNDAQKALCRQVLQFTDLVWQEYYTRKGQIQSATTFAELNAVIKDYSNLDSQNPNITILQIGQAT